MKKNLFLIVAMSLLIGVLSCGSKSSFESDVRKMANYRCKELQLLAKDPSDEKVIKQLEELKKEMEAFRIAMLGKYKELEKDKEMNEKAETIMEEVMAKCK